MSWYQTLAKRLTAGELENKPRELTGFSRALFYGLAVFFSAFHLYVAGPPFLGMPSIGVRRGLFMLMVLTLIFLKYPARRTQAPGSERVSLLDVLLILLTVVTFGYWAINFEAMIWRAGMPTTADVIFGWLAVLLSFEATRRVLGWVLVAISSAFVVYAYLGPYMPGELAHGGYSLSQIGAYLFSMEGIFGLVLDTTARFVVMFVVFGALMRVLGAGQFFVEFPYALTAGFRGGPAKAAVLASSLFGMISGSATANTVATGSFTIPLMKRAGYKPHVAGAIEPAASTGGMFMPPVMGAAVFLMAELIEVPYVHIMKVALVPAVIYFFSVAVMTHFEALKENLPVVPRSERENPWVLLRHGWVYILPVLVVVILLLQGMSPERAVFWSLVSMLGSYVVRVLLTSRARISARQLAGDLAVKVGEALKAGADESLAIGSVVGTVGVILGVISLTGLGFIFASSIFRLTFGLLPLAILLAFIAAYVLGMGMTVTSAYILLASLVAPALQRMGVDPLAAHFVIFWYSQTSNISPPVAMAAFAGAAIAGANPFQTGFTALKYSAFLFVMPLLFVYSPILMPDGLTAAAVRAMASAFLATIPYGAAVIGYYFGHLATWERLVLGAASIGLLFPDSVTDGLGLAIFGVVTVWKYLRSRAAVAPSVRVADK